MNLASLRDNPVIAALLGVAITGLGHLYLRRWLRALGWLAGAVTVGILFVPESAIEAVRSGTFSDPLAILPVVVVSAASVIDAYLIARTNTRAETGQTTDTSDAEEDLLDCPACGKPVEPEMGFCHWCTTEFEVVNDTELRRLDEDGSD
ncbi:MAG: hypothetical protein J07HX5_00434 [halophilic archaeon J07HX5]|jgi:hypothetical protein|nr:MAG: hypothetical protein J07HX5_00434 [halophilic archaeon J07HX5]